MKAWVVSAISFEAIALNISANTISEVVLAIISARKKVQFVKDYISALATVLLTDLQAQHEIAAYNKPAAPPKINNDSGQIVSYHDHPFHISAQLSRIHEITKINEWPWIKWQGVSFDRIEYDSYTYKFKPIKKEMFGSKYGPQAKFGLNNSGMFSAETYRTPYR